MMVKVGGCEGQEKIGKIVNLLHGGEKEHSY